MFVEQCSSLVPLLSTCAPEAEEQRRVSRAVIERAHEIDLFSAVVPTSLGGRGEDLASLANGTREMAHGCVSSAWTLSFLVLHAWLLSRFPEEAHDELFGNGPPLAPAPLAPTGTAQAIGDGSFRVSGRWEWATGLHHGDLVMVHAIVTGRADPSAIETRFLLVPKGRVQIVDVWQTSGMRATGSDTVVLDDVEVPERMTLEGRALLDPGRAAVGDGLAGLPVVSVLALSASASALGGAEAAVEIYRERIVARVLAYTLGDRAAEQPAAQIRYATALSDLRAARARWDAAIAAVSDAAARNAVDIDVRVEARLAAAATVLASRQIITRVCDGAGASVYMSDHPLQRIQRDVEMLKGHVIFDWDRTAELAGKHALGIPLAAHEMV